MYIVYNDASVSTNTNHYQNNSRNNFSITIVILIMKNWHKVQNVSKYYSLFYVKCTSKLSNTSQVVVHNIVYMLKTVQIQRKKLLTNKKQIKQITIVTIQKSWNGKW